MRTNPEHLRYYATVNRTKPTHAEQRFLWALKVNHIAHEFQYPFKFYKHGFIVDFLIYCKSGFVLIVEIDGGYHQNHRQELYDLRRQKELEGEKNSKIKLIRFTNDEVFSGVKKCLSVVMKYNPEIQKHGKHGLKWKF